MGKKWMENQGNVKNVINKWINEGKMEIGKNVWNMKVVYKSMNEGKIYENGKMYNAMYKCIKKEKWMKMESVWKKKEWCRRWDVCMNKQCIHVKRRGNEWKWKNELMNRRWEMYEQ